jgi:ubiquinone/menaquinone biosynthesis C-methylase UbiE
VDNPGNAAIRAELLAAVLDLAGKRLEGRGHVLDVGCGTGWLLGELARIVEPKRTHGVDLIGERIEATRARVPGADVRLADARDLPFEDGRFELVTLVTALSSMPGDDSIARALDEAARVTSPKGIVLCYEPRLPNPLNRSTVRISAETLEESLGAASSTRALTGFPPISRRLGPLTDRLYPVFASLVPTHRITVHEPGAARRSRG